MRPESGTIWRVLPTNSRHMRPNRLRNRFPKRGEIVSIERGRSGLKGLVLIAAVVLTVWFLWEYADHGLELIGDTAESFSEAASSGADSTDYPPQPSTEPVVSPATEPPPTVQLSPTVESSAEPVQIQVVDVPIGKVFSPVGFQITAVSDVLTLSETPPPGLRMPPSFEAKHGQFARWELSEGRSLLLAMDHRPNGAVMFVDANGNGDLTDDGAPLENLGDGYFATELTFSLPRISGIKGLKGDYRLWLYLSDEGRRSDRLRFYAMTQLKGRIRLAGKVFDIWLADNTKLDGDYRNDGLYIDLNGDERIDMADEFVPPGERLRHDGENYRFEIRR